MSQILKPDLCVIGAGSAGLSLAAGASQMGAKVVLIERERMGGECLNTGCVPSKALLAAAHAAQAPRGAARFGLDPGEPRVDFAKVYDHVHGAIAEIAPQDSVERYEAMGVEVIRASARFTGRAEVEAGGARIRARRFVIATGSRPAVPAIDGIDKVPYYTNETVFEARIAPDHLIVIGGGPQGMELSQAYRRLGARVSLLQRGLVLDRDDPELARILVDLLRAEGIVIHEGVEWLRLEGGDDAVVAEIERGGVRERIEGSHVLVATGRRANLEGLGLEAAGVAYDAAGVKVDRRLRTSNKRVYAIGDAAGPFRLTHMASYQAGIVLRNTLFRLPARFDDRAVPWVTYTEPELAHVGLTEEAAKARIGEVRILRWPFSENDRAVAEAQTDGLVKAVVTRKGRILGASILGSRAGELIQPWSLAISAKRKIGALANLIVPYPTFGEASQRAAASFYTPALFSERTARIVRFLARFG